MLLAHMLLGTPPISAVVCVVLALAFGALSASMHDPATSRRRTLFLGLAIVSVLFLLHLSRNL